MQGIVGVCCNYKDVDSVFAPFAVIGQQKFEYYFRKILSVGNTPTTINSQQSRSIASWICLLSVVHTARQCTPQQSESGIHVYPLIPCRLRRTLAVHYLCQVMLMYNEK